MGLEPRCCPPTALARKQISPNARCICWCPAGTRTTVLVNGVVVVENADHTGARLAWIPRRAGERGALEAGALPGLLPGARPVTDAEALEGFNLLSRTEGILPALESAHAIAYLKRLAPEYTADDIVIVNLSGRGDKDVDAVAEAMEVSGESH